MSWRNRIITIDTRFLLALYAIIPLSLLLVACDALFFQSRLRDIFPRSPDYYLIFLIIFNLPHIIASMVTYAEKEYLVAYKKPLLKGLLIVSALTFIIPYFIGVNEFFIFIALYTLYHVVMQQYGISLMLLKRRPNLVFELWKWLSISGGGLLYLDVYLPSALARFTSLSLGDAGAVLMALSAPFGLYYFFQISRAKDITWVSKLYFFGTYLILLSSCFYYMAGYMFLLVLVPRFIHDATAFTVYAVHDHNRNLVVTHNWFYKVLKPLRVSPLILCFPLAIALGWWLTMNQNIYLPAMAVVVILTLMHYYMEAYMWRRGMPHRDNVPFRIA